MTVTQRLSCFRSLRIPYSAFRTCFASAFAAAIRSLSAYIDPSFPCRLPLFGSRMVFWRQLLRASSQGAAREALDQLELYCPRSFPLRWLHVALTRSIFKCHWLIWLKL